MGRPENVTNHRVRKGELAMSENAASRTSVDSIVRRLLVNAQLRKVYDIDEDVLWECLRVLARMLREGIDADEAIKAESRRNREA